MKLFLHPGAALFTLAGIALVIWLSAPDTPVLGSVVKFAAFATMVFGIVGGIFLTFMVNRAEANNP